MAEWKGFEPSRLFTPGNLADSSLKPLEHHSNYLLFYQNSLLINKI